VSQELEVERKRLPPLEDRIVHLESDLASQEDAVRYINNYWFMVRMHVSSLMVHREVSKQEGNVLIA